MTTPIDLRISCLPHTWLIDLDGTVLTHNGYLSDNDRLLPGVTEFWQKIPECDIIILLSAREIIYAENTLNLLKKMGLRYDYSIFGLPTGERILINDRKPSGLDTAIALNLCRNEGFTRVSPKIDSTL